MRLPVPPEQAHDSVKKKKQQQGNHENKPAGKQVEETFGFSGSQY